MSNLGLLVLASYLVLVLYVLALCKAAARGDDGDENEDDLK
jgi:hypothetical protein